MDSNQIEINSRLSRLQESVDNLQKLVSTPRAQAGPEWYSVEEASSKLGVHKLTLYRQIEKNLIPHKRIGNRLMIPSHYVNS